MSPMLAGALTAVFIYVLVIVRSELMNRLFDLPPLTWIERLGVHLAAKRASQVWTIIEDSSSTNSRDPQNVRGQNRPLVQEQEFDL